MLQSTIVGVAITVLAMAVSGECSPSRTITAQHRERILDNYIKIWNGDLSLVNETFSSAMTLQIDRFPKGARGSVALPPTFNSSIDFAAFVERTRSTLREYKIIPQKSVGEGRGIAFRWVMEGVMGDNFTLPTTLQPGDTVTYNGTEYLSLDPCTGLVEEVDSAQDLITFMWNLGNNINLTPRKTT